MTADEARMDKFERLTLLHPRDASPANLRLMRKLAGLTRGQAACILDLHPSVLDELEAGTRKVWPSLAVAMAHAYDCGAES